MTSGGIQLAVPINVLYSFNSESCLLLPKSANLQTPPVSNNMFAPLMSNKILSLKCLEFVEKRKTSVHNVFVM